MWLALLVACDPPAPVELIAGAGWTGLPDGHPLAGLPCSADAWALEGGAIEVSTDGCSPFALRAELPVPIEPGDALEVVWWRGFLVAPEPAEGRFLLYVDGELLYERVEPIPAAPAAYTEAFEARAGGTELVWRVENHGANTWNLLRLTRL